MTYKWNNIACLSLVFITVLPSLVSGSQGGNDILGTAIGISFAVTVLTVFLTVYLPLFIWYKCKKQKKKPRHRGDSSSTFPLQNSLSTNGDAPTCPTHIYQPVATRDSRIKPSDPYSRRGINDEVSKWCTEHKLTEETRKQLKAKGFQQKEELESIDPNEIHMLDLPNFAQASLLKDILKKIQRGDLSPGSSANTSSDGVNLKLMRHTSKDSSQVSEGARLLGEEGRQTSIQSETTRFRYPSTRSNTVPEGPYRQISQTGKSPSGVATSPNSPNRSVSLQHQKPRFHGMLSDEGLYELAARIGHEYEQLSSYLKIPRKHLEQIKMDYPSRSQDRIYHILQSYRDNAQGDKAEIKGQLHKALMRCHRTDLAEDLLKEEVHCSQEKLVSQHSVV